MSKRHQTGYLFRKGAFWYVRFYDDTAQPDGSIIRRQVCRQVVAYSDRYRSKRDVRPLVNEFLRSVNECKSGPQSTMTITRFVEQHYLPHSKDNSKPSTYAAYRTQWASYLAPRLKKSILRDFRTVDAANLLIDIHREHGLGRSTLRHLKSFLSGVFTFAKNQGVLDGANPIRDAIIPRRASPPKRTLATTPDEVLAILDALEKAATLAAGTDSAKARALRKARAAVALMFFAGLRPGEARGARWEDYDGQRLRVEQSIWQTYTTEPKTNTSSEPVPVIEPLRSILTELRELEGNPSSGSILRGDKLGRPLNLDNLLKRHLVPTLKAAGLTLHGGWYSLRRGIATLVNSVEKDPMAAKGLLRHSSVLTTQKHYIKDVPEVTLNAMRKVEALCTRGSTQQDRLERPS